MATQIPSGPTAHSAASAWWSSNAARAASTDAASECRLVPIFLLSAVLGRGLSPRPTVGAENDIHGFDQGVVATRAFAKGAGEKGHLVVEAADAGPLDRRVVLLAVDDVTRAWPCRPVDAENLPQALKVVLGEAGLWGNVGVATRTDGRRRMTRTDTPLAWSSVRPTRPRLGIVMPSVGAAR